MKRSLSLLGCLATILLAGLLALATPAQAQNINQTLSLVSGWNAVWLEVEPTSTSGATAGQAKAPADVFTPAAISIVATPKALAGSAEFFGAAPQSVASVTTFNKEDWLQWKRSDLASTNNLGTVFGNRPYLIFTTAAVTLQINGRVRFFRPTWTPDRYNLLGFGLEGSRTFNDFFGPAGSRHPVGKIFTLNANGSWVKVTPSAAMISDKAYWIFCDGPSSYMGPMAVDFPNAVIGRLDFGGPGDAVKVGTESLDLKEITLTNFGSAAAISSVTATAVDSQLALYRVTPAPASLGYVRGNGFTSAFFAIDSQQSATLTVGAKRAFADDVEHTSLYRLRTSLAGASFYLPVTAVRSDVQQGAIVTGSVPVSSVVGLWAGDVTVNAATSIVVDGAPTQPAAGSAPLRILLHSDAGGTVRLLSQVTLMQTKTADPKVPGVPVLVLDPAKIPFFEGVKIRDGKRVGVRLESIAYDMPRAASAAAGLNLITATKRPETLKEDYDLSEVMTGAIGQTVSVTIALDPFHRSNPLRHVYHQDLTKGPQITRTLTLVFDSSQAQPDRLVGTFSERIQGLIKDNLTLTGTVQLRRVSPVDTLQGQ